MNPGKFTSSFSNKSRVLISFIRYFLNNFKHNYVIKLCKILCVLSCLRLVSLRCKTSRFLFSNILPIYPFLSWLHPCTFRHLSLSLYGGSAVLSRFLLLFPLSEIIDITIIRKVVASPKKKGSECAIPFMFTHKMWKYCTHYVWENLRSVFKLTLVMSTITTHLASGPGITKLFSSRKLLQAWDTWISVSQKNLDYDNNFPETGTSSFKWNLIIMHIFMTMTYMVNYWFNNISNSTSTWSHLLVLNMCITMAYVKNISTD